MRAENARVGAKVVDSYPFALGGTAAQAQAWKAAGVDAYVGYLGCVSPARLGYVLDAGLAFMAVTLAAKYDGAIAVAQCKALGLPAGVSVFLDVEGKAAFESDPVQLAAKINAWCDTVGGAGYMPCLYVGVPQPFTSEQLYKLKAVRYWRGQGSVRDKKNALAEPYPRGWCMTQMFPSQACGGVLVDFNMVGQDYKGDVPRWAVR